MHSRHLELFLPLCGCIYTPVSILHLTHSCLSCWPPSAVRLHSPITWPSTFRTPLPFNLKYLTVFSHTHTFMCVTIYLLRHCGTAGLSAQFKCHPLLSTLHPCPFTISCGLCYSRCTKKEIWHLCVFLVLFPAVNLGEDQRAVSC